MLSNRHTDTQTKYCNPRCARARRGLTSSVNEVCFHCILTAFVVGQCMFFLYPLYTFLPFNPHFCLVYYTSFPNSSNLVRLNLSLQVLLSPPLLHMHTHLRCLLRYASKRWIWYNSCIPTKIRNVYSLHLYLRNTSYYLHSYLALLHFILFMYPLGLCIHSTSTPPLPTSLYLLFPSSLIKQNKRTNKKTKQKTNKKQTKEQN